MEPFETVEGIAAPLMLRDIDTDIITPMRRIVGRTSREEMGHWAFEPLRYLNEETENPDFVLNQPPYREATERRPRVIFRRRRCYPLPP
ncbi:MAG TPA: hypothetical protein QGF05_10385 [Dehalococcoidia bacterium]|nr:hypothetical protein [Dehalococcoidia bacterium]